VFRVKFVQARLPRDRNNNRRVDAPFDPDTVYARCRTSFFTRALFAVNVVRRAPTHGSRRGFQHVGENLSVNHVQMTFTYYFKNYRLLCVKQLNLKRTINGCITTRAQLNGVGNIRYFIYTLYIILG
jgi:hypothetical protein